MGFQWFSSVFKGVPSISPTAFEEAFREHAHVFVLLLGSPVCWAAAFAGQLPWWLSGLGPGLAVLLCCLVLERPKEEAKQVKGAWWPKAKGRSMISMKST